MIVGAATDTGKVRDMNQDYYYCSQGEDGLHLYIVADGMGGHSGGEVASKISVNAVVRFITEYWQMERYLNNRPLLIKNALWRANREVYRMAARTHGLEGMGTTLSMALLEDKTLYTGHIGDSRIYLIQGAKAVKLTEDHSLVAELIRNGSISPEEGDNHPQKNIITRALGTNLRVDIDIDRRTLEEGDMLLLCTDGLTNMVGHGEMLELCNTIEDPQLLCEKLIEQSNNRGGKDNVTVIAVKVRWDG